MWAIRWPGISFRKFNNAPTPSSPKTPLSSKAISKTKSPRESLPGSWRTGRARHTASAISSATGELSNVFRHVDPQFRDFAAAVAAADIAAAKNQLTALSLAGSLLDVVSTGYHGTGNISITVLRASLDDSAWTVTSRPEPCTL